ncbi:sulfatase family protein [Virgibacillus natechei]
MTKKPNILFIMSDDHASHAISSYGSRINKTLEIDRLANEGAQFNNCFCTNSICTPSRATILTGKYGHQNGVRTLLDELDGRQQTVPKLLQKNGYQTAMIGKWHLGHGGHSDPTGFDYWNILPDQGDYINPRMIEMGESKVVDGYVTNIITDLSIEWLKKQSNHKPWFLMCHHKAPHRPWIPDEKHKHMYEDVTIPEPETFNDDYQTRAKAVEEAAMSIEEDLNKNDLKMDPPKGLTDSELKSWKYQRYIKDYLKCVASIDDNVGRILNYLDEENLTDDTIVIYTSDQGFFLGDHGWYDKRFIYEESLRMPLLIRYPKEIKAGSIVNDIGLNLDFASTFLDYAGVDIPADIQGESLRPLLRDAVPDNWRRSMYYRYWEHLSYEHRVGAHYGVRTHKYKLVYYYGEPLDANGAEPEERNPEWELFDLEKDQYELNNVYSDPAYENIVNEMKHELDKLQREYSDNNV